MEKELRRVVLEVAGEVDRAASELLTNAVDEKFQDIMKYQVECGGKRLRPFLAVATYAMMGGRDDEIIYPAAALEILHNYTLILDDIIDHGEKRRGLPTTWKKYGKSVAECASMTYAASIFNFPESVSKKAELYEILAKVLKRITDGQLEDLLFERTGRDDEEYLQENRYPKVEVEDYFEMVSRKTASLTQASCEIGGEYCGVSDEERKSIKSFGYNLGIAFQIQDDILDIFGEEKDFGKKVGKDIEERKMGNVVVLLANKEQDDFFDEFFKKEKISEDDVEIAIDKIKETDALEKAQQMKKDFSNKALANLDNLPQNEWNDHLRSLGEYLVNREK